MIRTTGTLTEPRPAATPVWWIGYLVIVGGGFFVAAIARRRITEPFLGLSLAILLVLLLGWILRPRATLYATLFLTAVSDQVTVWWFPFAKNLSSRESIAYVADSLTISPLQISLYAGVAVSVLRRYAGTRTVVPRTPLTWPLIAFTAFVAFGFVRGVLAGGDTRIAVLEGRALLHILLVFLIVTNECTERRHLRYALWAIVSGVVVQSLLSLEYLGRIDAATRDELERLTEHGSVLGQNLLVVTLLGLLLLRARAPWLKWALALGLVPTVYVMVIGERRAGVAALLVAAAVVSITLFWRRRAVFWAFTPLAVIVLTGYVAAFWNSDSSAAFPAQAIKTIIAPESASAEDQSSDLYRLIEAYDINFTIRTDPLKGVGFGRPFYRPVPLADISVFELNAYMPHNSVLWIWLKTGFGGFAAMFYLFGKTVMLGADRVRRTPEGIDLVVMLSAVAFVVMFAVFSYVDVSWDARNTVFLGWALAVCARSVSAPKDAAEPERADRAEAERSDAQASGESSPAMTSAMPSA